MMSDGHRHASHPRILLRLKRAEGHLRSVIGMIEEKRSCLDLASNSTPLKPRPAPPSGSSFTTTSRIAFRLPTMMPRLPRRFRS